ncbi:hypothetical protein HYT57_05645 [Candidatus Woesearchaeota archaeon]|nr:hypothetical protein [Candidatus Woesearchaeota archaeon]
MRKRNLVIFSLFLISMFIIAGCKEGAVGGPVTSGRSSAQAELNKNYDFQRNVGDGSEASISCPSVISDIKAFYYCQGDARNNPSVSFCPISDSYIGQKSASFLFNNANCGGDPCPGIKKEGILVANCVKVLNAPSQPIERCTGKMASGYIKVCPGTTNDLTQDYRWVLRDKCTPGNQCETVCQDGFRSSSNKYGKKGKGIYNGGECVKSECTGTLQANAYACPDTDQGLTQDYRWVLRDKCIPGNKCEAICNDGYTYSKKNKRCELGSNPKCIGTLPANAELCPGDDVVSSPTPYNAASGTYVGDGVCSSDKCEYVCKSGFSLYTFDSNFRDRTKYQCIVKTTIIDAGSKPFKDSDIYLYLFPNSQGLRTSRGVNVCNGVSGQHILGVQGIVTDAGASGIGTISPSAGSINDVYRTFFWKYDNGAWRSCQEVWDGDTQYKKNDGDINSVSVGQIELIHKKQITFYIDGDRKNDIIIVESDGGVSLSKG